MGKICHEMCFSYACGLHTRYGSRKRIKTSTILSYVLSTDASTQTEQIQQQQKTTEKVEELFSCSAFSVVFPHLWFLLSLMCTTTGIKKPALWFSAFYQCAQIITGKKSLIRCRNRSGQTIKFNL